MPWAASYAFNNVNELAIPIDQRNNELKAGTEWVNNKGMVRLDYWGSYFSNDIQTLTWDNPIRATDFNNGLAAAQRSVRSERLQQRQRPRARTGGAVAQQQPQLGRHHRDVQDHPADHRQRQPHLHLHAAGPGAAAVDHQLARSTTPTVLAAFPGLRQLPRSSAEAAVDSTNWLVNFNSRELRFVTIQARYRYNDHKNKTPHFDGREYVRFDAVPEEFVDDPATPYLEGFSEYFQIKRKNFDLNGTFGLKAFGSIRVGYANEQFEREGRGFSDVSENTFRAGVRRRGCSTTSACGPRSTPASAVATASSCSEIDYEEGPAGTQPGLRYYDEADRDRTKAMLVLSANPHDQVGVFFQFTTTRDTFLADESIPVGPRAVRPAEPGHQRLGSRRRLQPERHGALRPHLRLGQVRGDCRSRATPTRRPTRPGPIRPATGSWTTTRRSTRVTGYVDMLGLMQSKADLRVGYEMNDSDNDFNYYGPRIDSLTAAGQFIPLPNVINDWRRFTVDFKYYVSKAVGIGVGYWYENFDVTDWNTLDYDPANFTGGGPVGFAPSTGTPRIDWLGGLMTGYGNRPYSGGRFFARMLYRF